MKGSSVIPAMTATGTGQEEIRAGKTGCHCRQCYCQSCGRLYAPPNQDDYKTEAGKLFRQMLAEAA